MSHGKLKGMRGGSAWQAMIGTDLALSMPLLQPRLFSGRQEGRFRR